MSLERRASLPTFIEEIGARVLDAAFEVHSHLGPGLIESVYRDCLVHELRQMGHSAAVEAPVPLSYKGVQLGARLRLDILVDDAVVVELKAVEQLHPVHVAQLATYLRLAHKPLGFLLNFNVEHFRAGFHRVIWSRALP